MPDQNQIFNLEPDVLAIVYKPSEILGIIASYFSQQDATPLALSFKVSLPVFLSECISQIKNGDMLIDDFNTHRSLINLYSEFTVVYLS